MNSYMFFKGIRRGKPDFKEMVIATLHHLPPAIRFAHEQEGP